MRARIERSLLLAEGHLALIGYLSVLSPEVLLEGRLRSLDLDEPFKLGSNSSFGFRAGALGCTEGRLPLVLCLVLSELRFRGRGHAIVLTERVGGKNFPTADERELVEREPSAIQVDSCIPSRSTPVSRTLASPASARGWTVAFAF